MPFPPFLELSDTQPALAHSPMIRGLERTFAYIDEHGPIGPLRWDICIRRLLTVGRRDVFVQQKALKNVAKCSVDTFHPKGVFILNGSQALSTSQCTADVCLQSGWLISFVPRQEQTTVSAVLSG